jgi:hypothetical protein
MRLTCTPSTLSDALATLSRSREPRTLHLSDGVYATPISITEGEWRVEVGDVSWRGVALRVSGGARAHLSGASLHATAPEAVWVSGAALTIEGLSLSCRGGHAVRAEGGSTLHIRHATLHHAGACGVMMEGEGELSCDEVRFEWCGLDERARGEQEHESDGVWLDAARVSGGQGPRAHFQGCAFSHNRGDGLYAKGGEAALLGCAFKGNLVNGAYAGPGARLSLSACVFEESLEAAVGVSGGEVSLAGCALSGGEGVALFALEGARVRAEGCALRGGRRASALIDSGAQADLIGCSWGDPSPDLSAQGGISVGEGARARLERCEGQGARGAVIAVLEGGALSARGVTLRGGQACLSALSASALHLTGVSLEGGRDAGLMIEGRVSGGGGPFELQDVTVSAEGGVGVWMSDEARVEWRGGAIKGGERGVTLSGEAALTLRGCALTAQERAQVSLSDRASLKAEGCELRGRYEAGAKARSQDAGVEASGEAQVWLTDCRLSDHGRAQLILHGGARGHLTRCELTRGGDAGAFVTSGAHLLMEGGRVSDHLSAGLWVERASTLEGRAVEIYAQRSGGVFCRDRSQATLSECHLHHNLKAGFDVEGGSVGWLRGGVVSSGGGSGVIFQRGALGGVSGALIEGHPLVGLAICEGAAPSVEGCELVGGEGVALWLDRGAQGEVRGCWIYGEVGREVVEEEGARVRFEGNLMAAPLMC